MFYSVIQNSWRLSLKRKYKVERPQLTSNTVVQQMRQKYGRPGISGRKTKRSLDNMDKSCPKKVCKEVKQNLPNHFSSFFSFILIMKVPLKIVTSKM
jgi:translation initiation factor 2 beta subunit (eIF-2beta)/eIF-5